MSLIHFKFSNTWEQRKLNELCEYTSSNLTANDAKSEGYDLYDANSVIGKTTKNIQESDYISIIKDGAGVGRVRLLPKNSSFIGTLGGLIPNKSNLNFLFAILTKFNFNKLISGGTIPHIYFNQYGKEYVYAPFIEEQEIIGRFFYNLDTTITLHQRECIHHMINQVTKDSLFIDYYSQWRSVYKEGIKCQLKMYKIS
jgi:type I restriction enzyme, S subunit